MLTLKKVLCGGNTQYSTQACQCIGIRSSRKGRPLHHTFPVHDRDLRTLISIKENMFDDYELEKKNDLSDTCGMFTTETLRTEDISINSRYHYQLKKI